MYSEEVRPETVFLFNFIKTNFVSFCTVFDRSNMSFVCSQEVRPETVFLFKFIKTNSLWFKLCLIGRTRVLKSFHFCVQSVGSAGDCIFI